MLFYRRRLPHWFPENTTVFVTWRLAGSLPASIADTIGWQTTEHNALAHKFQLQDDQLDRCNTGPRWLSDPRIARLLQEAIRYGATVRGMYRPHAWVIMPNHVHAVWEPRVPMPDIMRWLNGRTSRTANRLLNRPGQAFWQEES